MVHLSTELNGIISEEKDKGERRKEEFKSELRKMIEDVFKTTEQLAKEVSDKAFLDINSNPVEVLLKIEGLNARCQKILALVNQCVQIQQALDIEAESFVTVTELKADITIREQLWQSLKEFKEISERWRPEKYSDIPTASLIESSEKHYKVAINCENRGLKESTAVKTLLSEVTQFKGAMPVIEAVSNKRLGDVHWKDIKDALATNMTLERLEFSLNDLLNLNCYKQEDEIKNISITATQEHNLRKQIAKIKRKWEKKGFTTKPYLKEQQRDNVVLITDTETLFTDLDDTLSTLNNIIASKYVRRLMDKAIAEKQKFDLLWQVADEWIRSQRNWLYLDCIFSSPDIRAHLKKESSDFETADKNWRQLMRLISTPMKNILILYATQDYLTKFQKLNKSMDKIKKELQNYLESKRKEFPRLYFLSDGELLPVLANSTDIIASESLVPKCFEGINRLDLGPGRPTYDLLGMCSKEGEHVPFKNVRMRVEDTIVIWLKTVEAQMIELLKKSIKTGYVDYFQPDAERMSWINNHFSQVVFCVSEIMWTEMCEYSIQEMKEDDTALIDLATQTVAMIKQEFELIKTPLQDAQRCLLTSLLTSDLHWKDIVEKIAMESLSSLKDFMWQVQLRFYLKEGGEVDEVIIKQLNTENLYGYEYMGPSARLVATPLTERCILGISSALSKHFGTAFVGAGNSGKTETLKDIAKQLGIQCVVFSCSEQSEMRLITKLFAGLLQQGPWAILDELNRVDIEVLSAISQQAMMIIDALRTDNTSIYFGEMDIPVKHSLGLFISMSKVIGVKNEIPENLKSLFRQIAINIPEYSVITEVQLFTRGFNDSKKLSQKLTKLYKLASDLIMKPNNYEFGIRIITTVINAAGFMKLQDREAPEEELIIKAIKTTNASMFLEQDWTLFTQLIKEIFTTQEKEININEFLNEELKKSMEKRNLNPTNACLQKAIQLFESLKTRNGIILTGDPGVGKSTCYEILKDTLISLKEQTKVNPMLSVDEKYENITAQVICPKALTLGELFGEESKDTKEWKYGLASKLLKKAVAEVFANQSEQQGPNKIQENPQHWIVFDGSMDTKWTDILNSALDENRILCLINAERIKLPEQVKILFEVENLVSASPATVSRCGIIHFSSSTWGWKAFMESWVANITKTEELFKSCEDLKAPLSSMIDETVEKMMALYEKNKALLLFPVNPIQLVTILKSNLRYWFGKIKKEETAELRKKKLMNYYAFSLAWSFGGFLPSKILTAFDDLIRPLFPKIQIPLTGTVLDYRMEVNDAGVFRWVHWKDFIQPYKYQSNIPFYSLFVPTVDTEKFSYIMEISLALERPLLLAGESGVGKTMIMKNMLAKRQALGETSVISMNFTATTTSYETQIAIESKLEPKKFKKILGPPGQSKAVVFIDDVNLPNAEQNTSQPPTELIRQLLTYGGFYGRGKPRWMKIIDTTLLCVAGSLSSGRGCPSSRFTHRFSLLNFPEPNEEGMRYIFESILQSFLQTQNFVDVVIKTIPAVVNATIDIYNNVKANLKPSPLKSQYLYSVREMAKTFQFMLMVTPKTLNSTESFIRIWVHESMKVYGDRLSDPKDVKWIQESISSVILSRFRLEWTVEDIFVKKPILFTEILEPDPEVSEHSYEEVCDNNKFVKSLEDALISHNQKNIHCGMDLILFDQAINYLLSIERVLRQKRGHCMLLGNTGRGKESLTAFAAFLSNSKFNKVKISKSYRRDNFRDEIRSLLLETGIEGKSITFFLNENQLSNELFLDDINALLTTGELTNVFRVNDMQTIMESMGPIALSQKKGDSKEAKYSCFVERVKDNFHIVLSMNHPGESLRLRCRKYPVLITSTTIIYFDKWSEPSLQTIFKKLVNEKTFPDEILFKSSTITLPQIHFSAIEMSTKYNEEENKKVQVVPKNYIDTIKSFNLLYKETKDDYNNCIDKLSKGLANYNATLKNIAELKESLTTLQPVIEEYKLKADKAAALKEVEGKKLAEEELKIESDKNVLYQQKTLIEVSRSEAKKELDYVRPLLDEAKSGLSNLTTRDIINLRSIPTPSKAIISVMQVIMMILENTKVKHDWAAAKAELVQGEAFIRKLKEIDIMKLAESTITIIRGITVNFDMSDIGKTDKGCVYLANWCIAIQKCYDAYLKVLPQEEKLKKIEEEYKIKMQNVQKIEDSLEVQRQKVKVLEAEYKKLSEESRTLVDKREKAEYKLANAAKVVELLGEEAKKWDEKVKKMKEREKEFLGNMILSASSLSYIPPYTANYRLSLLNEWKEICKSNRLLFSEDYSLVKVLSNSLETSRWTMLGLANDRNSLENGLLMTRSKKWPLVIDPEGIANKWIRNLEKKGELLTAKMTYEPTEYFKFIDKACQTGKPLLLEDAQSEFESAYFCSFWVIKLLLEKLEKGLILEIKIFHMTLVLDYISPVKTQISNLCPKFGVLFLSLIFQSLAKL